MRHLPALLEALFADGVLPTAHRPLGADAVADALWLARFMGPVTIGAAAGAAAVAPGQGDTRDLAPATTTGAEAPPPPPALPPPDPSAPPAPIAPPPDEGPVHVAEGGAAPPGGAPGLPATNLAVGRPNLLDQPLAIDRALRPLMGRLPSPTRRVLDEAATVHRWAEARVPIPVLRGAPERRWELALVVDAHPAFELWAPLIDELTRLLTRHGAFRDVRLWCLGPERPASASGDAASPVRPPVRLWPGARPGIGAGRAPAVLRDPRRLILIASDFSGPAWRRAAPDAPPANLAVLADWQRRQPVALLHLLPGTLWPRTALGSARLTRVSAASAAHPALPPRLLVPPTPKRVKHVPKAARAENGPIGLPLPVLHPDAAGLGAWARLLGGRPGARMPAVWLDAAPTPPGIAPPPLGARDRLLRFQAGASAGARALAQACAGMPLTLSVVRLVQQTCHTGGGPAAIAELFLSGLLRRAPDADQPEVRPPPLMVLYDYVDDVRQLLIDAEPPARLAERLRLVSATVRRNLGSTQDFLARWMDPEQPPDLDGPGWTPSQRPFAVIRLAALRRLGGRYAEQIGGLVELIEPAQSPGGALTETGVGTPRKGPEGPEPEPGPLPGSGTVAASGRAPGDPIKLTLLGYSGAGKSTFLTAALLASGLGRLRSSESGRPLAVTQRLSPGEMSFFASPVDDRGVSRLDLLRKGQQLPAPLMDEWVSIRLALEFAGNAPIECLTFDYIGTLAVIQKPDFRGWRLQEERLQEQIRTGDCLYLFFDASLHPGQHGDTWLAMLQQGQGEAIQRVYQAFTESRSGWPIILVVTKADLLFAGKPAQYIATEIDRLNGRGADAIERGKQVFRQFMRRQGAGPLAEVLLAKRRRAVVRVVFVAALGATPSEILPRSGNARAYVIARLSDWVPLGIAEALEYGVEAAIRRRRLTSFTRFFGGILSRPNRNPFGEPETVGPVAIDVRSETGTDQVETGSLAIRAERDRLIDRVLTAELRAPHTNPRRRLEIGDLLAAQPAGDPRPGVGLGPDGLPDIAWVEIPALTVADPRGTPRTLPGFRMARYPVTNAQFQAFIDAGGYPPAAGTGLLQRLRRRLAPGAGDGDWWRGLARPRPARPRWPQPNRPRTDVDWTEALAFARWLAVRLDLPSGSIRLPTEAEWERAARGPERLVYPWGNGYLPGFANVDETAGYPPWNPPQTTAVGLYPHGASAYGVEDLCGTVWEWCLNPTDPAAGDAGPGSPVLRGGCFDNPPQAARADDRGRDWAPGRNDSRGFRLVWCPPDEPAT